MNNFIIIVVTTTVLTLFAIGYILILFESNRKIIKEQKKRIIEIEKSEHRYKTLFDNSLAGIIKFDFTKWKILDANQSAREMFNSKTMEEFQKSFISMPVETLEAIEDMLTKDGLIEECELELVLSNKIVRKFIFSARKEDVENIAHGIIIFDTAKKMIG